MWKKNENENKNKCEKKYEIVITFAKNLPILEKNTYSQK